MSRIRAGAEWAQVLPDRVGLLFGSAADCLVADLALSFAGKELVPLPACFSDAQLAHIIATAALSHVVCDDVRSSSPQAGTGGERAGRTADCGREPAADARRIIFTSGSTGRPKGVRLSARQVLASASALADATGASADDRYLSLLPSALLLEQVDPGIYVPLSVGACVHLPEGSFGGPHPRSIAGMVEDAIPTATVLVPALLTAWMH